MSDKKSDKKSRFSVTDIFTAPLTGFTNLIGGGREIIEGIKDTDVSGALFGDVGGEDAAAAQAAENIATQNFIKQQAEQARGDIFRLFPAAEENRRLGNLGAQQTLQQGLPQILAALRGTPINLSQIEQTMPQFTSTGSLFPQNAQAPLLQEQGLRPQRQALSEQIGRPLAQPVNIGPRIAETLSQPNPSKMNIAMLLGDILSGRTE